MKSTFCFFLKLTMNDGWAQRPTINPGVADPDGLETIDDFQCVESCPARRLGEQSGESGSNWRKSKGDGLGAGIFGVSGGNTQGQDDKGTAVRFFKQCDWSYERIEQEELWNGGMENRL